MEDITSKIDFFKKCKTIKQDFSGHSSALRYVCEDDNGKYFVKIYEGNDLSRIKDVESVYEKLNIPRAKILETEYLTNVFKTFVVYEFIEGDELLDLTMKLNLEEIEKLGYKVGGNLHKFSAIKCNEFAVVNSYEKEFKELFDILYISKDLYESKESKKLYYIDLDRLHKSFLECKKYLYRSGASYIHGDINLHNVLVKDGVPYFIDTSTGKESFRALDFRGNCWFGWDGDNKINEQAMYRGIYKGLFGGKIPEEFHKELACTMIYEFLLKIRTGYEKNDMGKIEYSFQKFGDIFDRTNYFENYKFEWFNEV